MDKVKKVIKNLHKEKYLTAEELYLIQQLNSLKHEGKIVLSNGVELLF